MLQVIDLGSRMKLEPVIKPGAFTGEEVAEHLNYLKHKHEVPLLLKRDNGSNLNSNKVFSILKMFAVIPFNSSPGFPQFNGVMERSQGKIKRYLRAIQKDREELDSFAVMVHLSVERANQCRQCSAGREERMDSWEEEFLHFIGRNRKVFIWKSSVWRNGFRRHFPGKDD